MKRIVTLLLSLYISLCVFAQFQLPDQGPVYITSEVPRIDININPDTLDWIYDHPESDIEFHADFMFTSSEENETFEDIGFRLRGNTSRYSAKKSFKLSFNTFVEGGDFHGFEKMNLNGEHNDPSVCRARIGWDLARIWDLPGSRANHVQLYINGNYHGLYLNVEHIDEEFTGTYFDSKNGNLYKCLWPADLAWKGDNPESYKEEFSGRRAYDLKINEEIDDYTGLRDLIKAIDNTSPDQFYNELNKIFNVQEYLKFMALEVVLGHWDDYIYNKNNYYLYHNPISGRFEFLLYDLDNTMGIDWSGISWDSRNIYSWGADWEPRPLYDNIMSNPILRDQYSFYVEELTGIINSTSFVQYIEALHSTLLPYISNDPYYPLDYGFSTESFNNSFTESWGSHVKKGIIPYLSARASSALSQLENYNMYPVIKYPERNSPGAFSEFVVSVYVIDDQPDMTVELQYQINSGEVLTEQLYDDGLHNDGDAGDHIFGGSAPATGYAATISYNIAATDNIGQTSYVFADFQQFEILEGGDYALYINEFMADNETYLADQYGEYDDWIELWNGGSAAIDLDGMFLSDDAAEPDKYMLPDITLQPGDFILIWADKDEDQGDLHAGFKLSKDGEYIGLFDVEASGYALIDEIDFGEQETDISYGREQDGDDQWITFNSPTAGTSNNESSIEELSNNGISVWPVPANNILHVQINNLTEATLSITDIAGRKIQNINLNNSEATINITDFKPGVYFVYVEETKAYVRFIKY